MEEIKVALSREANTKNAPRIQSVSGDAGVLQAALNVTHGWYWRNRSGVEVTITLKTREDYVTIKRVL